MQVENYLKKYQPVIYQSFQRALVEKHLSHAYLLVGNPGTPLIETAKFLAKSLICDDPSPFACNNCITCLRVDDDNYPDFIVFDGSKESIKKGSVQTIESQFEKTAFESKGIKIYILHLVENMTEEAINAILKFLEEPKDNVYAFLTTNNENSVLQTIISRCQTMHLKLIDRNEVINEAISMGIENKSAELLSYFYNNAELIFELTNNEEENQPFLLSRDALDKLLNAFAYGSKQEAIFVMQNEIEPLVSKKETFRFFLDLLIQIFEDLVNIQNSREITLKSYDTILHEVSSNLHHINESLMELLKQRNLVNINLNTSLQLDHLIYEIVKE